MWKNSLAMRQFIALCIIASCVSVAYSQERNLHGDSSVDIVFDNDTITLNPGEKLTLDCGARGEFRYCFWERGGERPKTIQVVDVRDGFTEGVSNPENIDNGNECSIVIDSVSTYDNAEWTCKFLARGSAPQMSKMVVVTVRPTQPKLEVYEDPLMINEDTMQQIACIVPAARPAAKIRWFIDDHDITIRSETDDYPIDAMGTYRSNSTLYYTFSYRDDRSILKCSVEHQALVLPEQSEVTLDIKFKPYAVSSLDIYGIPMTGEYEIKFYFTANPEPELVWFIGNEEIIVPGVAGRFMANLQNINGSLYVAILKITDFTPEDLSNTYRLHASNEFGERNFDISLSTGPAPPDGDFGLTEYFSPPENNDSQESVGTGTVVAISVIVVLIIIILLIIGIMRYKQMFCFGKKDKIKNHMKDTEDLKEEHSDTESAVPPREPNNSKKATNLLKNIRSKFPPMPSRKGQKEPRLDKLEEGENKEQVDDVPVEEKGKTNPEVVYAELELANGENKKECGGGGESTEYAEIVGTVQDNKRREQRE